MIAYPINFISLQTKDGSGLLVFNESGISQNLPRAERRIREPERITKLDFSAECSSDFLLNGS
jgi:hypothetical protein